jgi:hypothetical protein
MYSECFITPAGLLAYVVAYEMGVAWSAFTSSDPLWYVVTVFPVIAEPDALTFCPVSVHENVTVSELDTPAAVVIRA